MGQMQKTLQSAFVKFQYDVVYSYKDGNIEEPDIEAGTALRMLLTVYHCSPGNPTLNNKEMVMLHLHLCMKY